MREGRVEKRLPSWGSHHLPRGPRPDAQEPCVPRHTHRVILAWHTHTHGHTRTPVRHTPPRKHTQHSRIQRGHRPHRTLGSRLSHPLRKLHAQHKAHTHRMSWARDGLPTVRRRHTRTVRARGGPPSDSCRHTHRARDGLLTDRHRHTRTFTPMLHATCTATCATAVTVCV